MGGNALQQGKSVADSVASVRCEGWRAEKRVYGDDLLEQAAHDTKGMPKDQR